jgi:hypothetical protein
LPSPSGNRPQDSSMRYRIRFAGWSRRKPPLTISRDERLIIDARLNAVANGWSGAFEDSVGACTPEATPWVVQTLVAAVKWNLPAKPYTGMSM